MPFITNEEAEQKKRNGEIINRFNCGWNLSSEEIAKISKVIDNWKPKTEKEKRDKKICYLAFIKNMNAQQIQRLNDPLIVGMGNRSKGKPLSGSSILTICYNYFPFTKDSRKGKRSKNHEKRTELYKKRQITEDARPKVCACCGDNTNIRLHHVIPLSMGGSNDYFNLIYLCHGCHTLLHNTIYNKLQSAEIPKRTIIE